MTTPTIPLAQSAISVTDLVRVTEIPATATVEEAAQILRCSRAKTYSLLAAGELDSYTIDRRRIITGASIAALIRRRMQSAYAPTCAVAKRAA
jgi:excisionase family DNA binding protein